MNVYKSRFFNKLLLLLIISNIYGMALAQVQEKTNRIISLPDIPGYITLKCDFHMHTVFSDGHVWPTFRVNEAIRDGLDVISLTEHIVDRRKQNEINRMDGLPQSMYMY